MKGLSGEISCSQYLPETWKLYSKEVLGYVAPVSKVNDIYISSHMIQKWLDNGKELNEILLIWNAGGNAKKCGKGVNSKKVPYNSCEYVKNGIIVYNNL